VPATSAKIVTKFKKKKPIGYEVSDGQVSVRNGNIVVIGRGTIFKKGSVLPNGKNVGDNEMMFDGKAYVEHSPFKRPFPFAEKCLITEIL
jgi:ribosomal protein L27